MDLRRRLLTMQGSTDYVLALTLSSDGSTLAAGLDRSEASVRTDRYAARARLRFRLA